MEAVKQALGVIGTIIGVLTALVTLYAKYLDIKKKVARDRKQALASAPADAASSVVPNAIVPPPVLVSAPIADSQAITKARAMVKAPAIATIVAGGIGLVFNLLVAGYGFVDQFVTPLSTESRQKREAVEFNRERTQAQGGRRRVRPIDKRMKRRR